MSEVQIVLNHLYLIVGDKVIDQLKSHEWFMQDLANIEHKTITSQDHGSWTYPYTQLRFMLWNELQAREKSCSRCRPIQIALLPGALSDLRFKKPPN